MVGAIFLSYSLNYVFMKKNIVLFGFLILIIASCKKESENLLYPKANEYYPLQIGKMFIYRCDSTVPCCFNASLITKSYQAMDTVESTFTDNSGRVSYRIYRYLRDTAETQPWRFAYTIVATPTIDQIEYQEENFRFIKLHNPVKNDFSWNGNSYINTSISENLYLDNWNYSYQKVNESYATKGIKYDSTATVLQIDDFSPEGPFDPNLSYQQRNYSVEVYAKGIGLVYKDFLHWVWQGNAYEDGAYGVRLSLLRHN